MVVTRHPEWARSMRSLRNWGDSWPRHGPAPGYNLRMDGLQGAILNVKLRHLDKWNQSRRALAAHYRACVQGPALRAPAEAVWTSHSYHIFAVRAASRDRSVEAFRARGIETRIHYPIPIHRMESFRELGYRAGDFPHAEAAAREVLSIPVCPELNATEANIIATALREVSVAAEAVPPGGFE